MKYVGIIKLLVLILSLTLLSVNGYMVNTVISESSGGILENQENAEEPVKWSGLEMCFEDVYDTENFDFYFDELITNGFTQIRINMTDWAVPKDVDVTKTAALAAIAKGFDVIWGVGSSLSTLTAANWNSYVTAVKGCAAWAEANGVYEFLLGNEEERHNDDTTLTDAQLRTNLRTLATSVQAIFTNGDVGYGNSCEFLSDWITEGRGDIDQLSWMFYMNEANWRDNINDIIANFGADHTYINEFNLDSGGYSYYSLDEAVQAAGISKMLKYIKASGITRAFFFCYTIPPWYEEDTFEVLKEDGTYRLLWNQALLDSGSVKSTADAKTTTKISLPDTIESLISKIIRKQQKQH